MMNRWDELERLGKLRADGILSDDEFEAQKRRILEADGVARADSIVDEAPFQEPIETRRDWTKIALVGGAIALLIVLIWLFSPSSTTNSNSSDAVMENTATVALESSPEQTTYSLRSNIAGASLVRIEQLPTVTPYGDNSDDYCGETLRATTAGGKIAEQRGWRVVKEAQFHGLDAVLVVRGYDPGTSGHCFSKDPNLAFFKGDRIVGVLYSKGKNGIGMNDVQNSGDHLRVWDDVSAVGQISLDGAALTFDRITGSDEVCDGKYRVPVVFGQPYSKARQILGNSGWIARPSTEETSEGDRTEGYRTRFPEVDSCSGTGYAYCSFGLSAQDGVAKISVTTAGEDDDPVVTNYDVSCDGRQE